MSKLDQVKGHQKVAAFLLSLEPEARATVMGKLAPDVVQRVASAMVELDSRLTEAGVVELLKSDVAKLAHARQRVRACNRDSLHELLVASLGRQRAEATIAKIHELRLEERPFAEVEARDPYDVGRVLRNESHAVAAAVLAHIDPTTSAAMLKVFDPDDRIAVVKRIASLEPPSPAVLRSIAAKLVHQVDNAPPTAGDPDPSARLKTVADLLNNSTPELEKGVIEAIASEDDDMARELREFMFTWEDIAGIDTRTMQKILGTVDTKTLSIALKGCSPEVESNLLGNLSSRVRDMVDEERELAGPVPRNEVEMARNEIMTNIRAMIETGEFRPSKGGDDLVA